ncbi:tetratricopeptide repeat protein [Thalassotalea ganghwensis]
MHKLIIIITIYTITGCDVNVTSRAIGGDCSKIVAKQDWEKAITTCEEEANQGSHQAMYELGLIWRFGRGVDQNFKKAKSWYEKAVALNNTDAMVNLGAMYLKGLGVEKDIEYFKELTLKAAEMDNANALYSLATMHYKGEFLEQDEQKAMELYRESGLYGNANAMYIYGNFLFKSEDTKENSKGLIWILTSIGFGYPIEQSVITELLEDFNEREIELIKESTRNFTKDIKNNIRIIQHKSI